MGQMGKWYILVPPLPQGAIFTKTTSNLQKTPCGWQCRRRSISPPIQEKKIAEQEKELMALLNFRFGYGTWDELKEMRPRLQSKEKKKFMPKQN